MRDIRPPPLPTLAAGACVAAPLLILVDAPPWARFPAVLLLLSLAPGTALLRLLQPPAQRIEPGLAVCFSLAVTVVIAQCMLWAGAWPPKLFIYLLAGICLACMASRRSRRPGPRRILRRAREAWSAGRATLHRGWDPVPRHERAAGLIPPPPPEPAGSDDRDPDRFLDDLITSILIRADGDPAALAVALSALLALDGSDGADGRNAGREPVQRPARRRFSAEYKVRILREAQACTGKGELSELLRREGLSTSHLRAWRKKRDEGALDGPRGREPLGRRDADDVEPRRRAERTKAELENVCGQIEIQPDVSELTELLEP